MQSFRLNSLLSRSFTAIRTVQSSGSRSFCEDRPLREQSVNEVTLLGRVGKISVRGSEEKPVITFSLATNNYYKDEPQTAWHKVAVFKPSMVSSLTQYLSTGTRIFVKGSILYGQYQDENGVTKPTTTIVADKVISVSTGRKFDEQEAQALDG